MTYTMYEFIYLHVNTKYGKHKTARKQNKRKTTTTTVTKTTTTTESTPLRMYTCRGLIDPF